MTITKYNKTCSFCGKRVYYSTKRILVVAIKKNKKCKLCCKSGTLNHNFGKKVIPTLETRLKLSLATKNRYSDIKERIEQSKNQQRRYYFMKIKEKKRMSKLIRLAMHRPDVRKKHLDALHHSNWIKVRTDKGQIELLNKWNNLGFNFNPNYKVKTDTNLFYIDGYDPINNVVIEYDTKYHNKPSQKEKDLVRQQKIINILNPRKFWRVDSTTKTVKNIMEDY